MNGRNDGLGNMDIASEVFAAICGYAAVNSFGVKGMAVRGVKDGLVRLLGIDAVDKGVKIVFTETGMEIELHIIVALGVNIRAACRQIMNHVKYVVERLTGEAVSRIDICVDSALAE